MHAPMCSLPSSHISIIIGHTITKPAHACMHVPNWSIGFLSTTRIHSQPPENETTVVKQTIDAAMMSNKQYYMIMECAGLTYTTIV